MIVNLLVFFKPVELKLIDCCTDIIAFICSTKIEEWIGWVLIQLK